MWASLVTLFTLLVAFGNCSPVMTIKRDESTVIAPKVMLVTGFTPETNIWLPLNLTEQHFVEGLMPGYQNVNCSTTGDVCVMAMGMAELGDSLAMAALWLNPKFDLTKTYFIVNGITGISPRFGTMGSISVSRFVVGFEMGQSLLGSDLPSNFSDMALFSLFTGDAYQYPATLAGTEAFELNENLIDRFVAVTSDVELQEVSPEGQEYRQRYVYAPAKAPPGIIKCDVISAMAYWHGEVWAKNAEFYSSLVTNGTANYCVSTEDDGGTMVGLVRGAYYKKLDFSRVLVLHGGSNFDRPPAGDTAYQSLFVEGQSGFLQALENLYRTGAPFVEDIVANWDTVYEKGLAPGNYIGDIFGTLGGVPDFGPGPVEF